MNGRHDTEHNDTQQTDIQHNIVKYITQNNTVLLYWISFMASVTNKPFLLSWMLLCLMSLCWVSLRHVLVYRENCYCGGNE